MRRCRHCREHNIPKGSPRTQFVCGVECAVGYQRAQQEKRKAAMLRAAKRERIAKTKEFKKNAHSYQFDLTKKEAQKLANLLDAALPCICCDEPRGKAQFCGGHAKSAGSHPEIALDLRNVHGQRNALCNQHKSGNWSGDKDSKGYRQGLIDRYGMGIIEWLESYHPPRKYTGDELIALRKLYAAEVKRLKQGHPPSRDWRSLNNNAAMPQGRDE